MKAYKWRITAYFRYSQILHISDILIYCIFQIFSDIAHFRHSHWSKINNHHFFMFVQTILILLLIRRGWSQGEGGAREMAEQYLDELGVGYSHRLRRYLLGFGQGFWTCSASSTMTKCTPHSPGVCWKGRQMCNVHKRKQGMHY